MALDTTKRKLTGTDGTLFQGTLGVLISGDGATPLPTGNYIVAALAGSTALPGSIRVGDYLTVRSGITITPAIGDDVYPLTETELCDIQSWQANFTAAEIETTTFCDDLKTYEAGKPDSQGTLQGVTTTNVTTSSGGFLNRFIDIIQQDGSSTYTVSESSNDVLFAKLVYNKTVSKGDEYFTFAPIVLFGVTVGADQDAAQAFSSNFRFASDDRVNIASYQVAR